jgi:microcystin-dependent protein
MNQFIGQLLLASWNWAPKDFATCDGQLLPISYNQALFSLLGTFYGGNGITTFGLPNLQGRAPVGFGPTYTIGQSGGEENHTLVPSQVPSHTHTLNAFASSDSDIATNRLLGGSGVSLFAPAASLTPMNNATIASIGGQPHENRQPFLVMNWCIALRGIFPSRS